MRAGIGLIFRWESLGTGILLLGMGDRVLAKNGILMAENGVPGHFYVRVRTS